MGRIVYVNGRFLAEEEATVSIFDRGFLFADAVYEVIGVLGGRLVEYDGHAARLQRSLAELGMKAPCPESELLPLCRELVARNSVGDGRIYLQVTRGAADRDFHYPPEAEPTLVMFTQKSPCASQVDGLKILSVPDQRWGRRDIKTVQLLAAAMAKMAARDAGCDDAWLVEDGMVTEGTSSNAFIVRDNAIVTRALSTAILPGVTRAALLRLAAEAGIGVEERPFAIMEAQRAMEAFITSTTAYVTPVVEIDGQKVGSGRPGPLATRLRELYIDECRKQSI